MTVAGGTAPKTLASPTLVRLGGAPVANAF